MATAKERGHKDWGFGGVNKRDFRADKSDGDNENNRAHSKRWYTRGKGRKSKKNTAKWCRGVEGRKHTLAVYNKYTFAHTHKCLACGKEVWGKVNRDDYDFELKKWEDLH